MLHKYYIIIYILNNICVYISDCNDPTPVYGTSNFTASSYGTVIEISCNTGYTLIGASIVTCTYVGEWDSESTCEATGKLCTTVVYVVEFRCCN